MNQTYTSLFLAIAGWLAISWGGHAYGQAADPTQMSPQIAELLKGVAAANGAGEEKEDEDDDEADKPPVILRLRGLVLRNDQQGVAFLVEGEDRVAIPLDRSKIGKFRIAVGGRQYELLDFHQYGLELRDVVTAETISVN